MTTTELHINFFNWFYFVALSVQEITCFELMLCKQMELNEEYILEAFLVILLERCYLCGVKNSKSKMYSN
jgi:hypothetical protein